MNRLFYQLYHPEVVISSKKPLMNPDFRPKFSYLILSLNKDATVQPYQMCLQESLTECLTYKH